MWSYMIMHDDGDHDHSDHDHSDHDGDHVLYKEMVMKIQNQNRSNLPSWKFKANKLGTFQLVRGVLISKTGIHRSRGGDIGKHPRT